MSAIEVSYHWSEQEYLEAADQHGRFGGGDSKDKIVAVVVGVLIVLSLYMMMQRGFQPADSMAFVLAVYWFGFRKRMHKNLLLRRFKSSEQKDKNISLSITDEQINAQTEGQSEGTFDWSSVTKVVRTGSGFLMYRGANYLWLPNKAFASDEESTRFAALSERKATQFVDKSGA